MVAILCAAVHDVGLGQIHRCDFVGGFEFAEGEGEAFANAVVVDGENVGAAKAEDENISTVQRPTPRT